MKMESRKVSGCLADFRLWIVAWVAPIAFVAFAHPPPVPPPGSPPPAPDPRLNEVPLPAQNGWNAFLVLDNAPTGVWTIEAFDVFAQHGSPEIVGLDDLGRAHICVSYSGKWTPTTVISDGKWLGGLAYGDVDARIAGAEIYTGSQQGNPACRTSAKTSPLTSALFRRKLSAS